MHRELKRALRKGARASRLARYSPQLVDLLRPESNDHPDWTIYDRAIEAERIIREALASIGGTSAEALATIFCLNPGTLELTLERRREIAGGLLGLLGESFRRERHEGLLLWDLGIEVYQRARFEDR